MALPLDFIKALDVSELAYPLYDHFDNPARCFFALGRKVIWDVDEKDSGGHQIVFPAAITLKTTLAVTLSTTGLATIATHTPPFALTARLGTMEVYQTSFVEPLSIKGLSMTQPIVGNLPNQTKTLPWKHYGDLEWVIKGSKPEQGSFSCTTSIEIYTLPLHLPPYYSQTGIPLALLRMDSFLASWMRTVEKPLQGPAVDWPAYAIAAMHDNPMIEYDTFQGATKYTHWTNYGIKDLFKNHRGLFCWLDLWLSDVLGVSLKGAKQSVNCYDLAALCQVLVSLGVDMETQNVRMKFMHPYGFIKPTQLIGRKENPAKASNPDDLCNNPFYMTGKSYYTKEMYDKRDLKEWRNVTPLKPQRSAFGNHMFLSIVKRFMDTTQQYVLDACCGPQVGLTALKDYPTAAIDQDMRLYDPPDGPGTTSDIEDGVGVSRLVTSRCFARTGTIDPASSGLIDKLEATFKDDGSWAQPYLTAPTSNSSAVTATWTFQPKDPQGEVYVVNISSFPTAGTSKPIVDNFNKRIASAEGWVKTPGVVLDAYNDDGAGTIWMFGDEPRMYYCTIESRFTKAAQVLPFKKKLEGKLDTVLTVPRPTNPSYVNNIVWPAQTPQVGETFTLTVPTTKAGREYWRGYNINVDGEALLFMECREQATSVDFHMLARQKGTSTVTVVIYGGSLESDQRFVDITVV